MSISGIERAYAESLRLVEAHPTWGIPDSHNVVLAGERHREAWKPPKVRLLLIAESHLFTDEQEELAQVAVPMCPDLPSEFVRLIYCLGYGHGELVDRAVPGNNGTPQYWAIFGKLAALPTPRTWEEKLAVLLRLKELGVWLLDSSLHSVCKPGGYRLPTKVVRVLQAIWWNHVGREIVTETCPERICGIGKDVSAQLEKLSVPLTDWILQPNGARTLEQRAFNDARLDSLAQWLHGVEHLTIRPPERLPKNVEAPSGSNRYRASRLEFRRKVIDPLQWDETFEVETPHGLYRFTKSDFYAAFPRIVVGESYVIGGRYNGANLHLQAERFKVKV